MAKIKNGILGAFSGTVGTVVGAPWRDIETMRAVAKPRKSKASPAELAQQTKFSLVSSFLRPLKNFLTTGFRDFAIRKTGANAAQSYNLKSAVIVSDGEPAILCSEVLVCRGDLQNVKEATATSSVKGQVDFTWKDNSGLGKACGADNAIFIVLCHGQGSCLYTLQGGLRRDGKASFPVNNFSGHEVHTWISFLSKDGKDIANSLFTGQLVVA
ncbi:MAG TPA: DUF6266 family protein [Chitinophagaceae bacterium]